jgi:hypothetical protein
MDFLGLGWWNYEYNRNENEEMEVIFSNERIDEQNSNENYRNEMDSSKCPVSGAFEVFSFQFTKVNKSLISSPLQLG